MPVRRIRLAFPGPSYNLRSTVLYVREELMRVDYNECTNEIHHPLHPLHSIPPSDLRSTITDGTVLA